MIGIGIGVPQNIGVLGAAVAELNDFITSLAVSQAAENDPVDVAVTYADGMVTPVTLYVVGIADGATAPSKAQIQAGTDASDTAAAMAFSFAASVNGTDTASISDVLSNDYDFYTVAVDNNSDVSEIVSDLGVTLAFNSTPASITQSQLKSGMTFSGGVLTAVDNAGTSIIGSPAEGPNGGFMLTEATAGANYVKSVWAGTSGPDPSGAHVAIAFRRNSTADNRTILIGAANTNEYTLQAQSGLVASAKGLKANYGNVITNTTNYPAITKDELWQGALADTNLNIVLAEDIRMDTGEFFWGRYGAPSYSAEIEVLGFLLFTDWADAANIEIWLRGESE